MHVISAALAFAITMLVLSMVVSILVETIHRILGMRERGLYYMLGQLYDYVLQPYRRDPNNPNRPPSPALRTDFQDRMSENRAPVAVSAPAGTARISYPLLGRRESSDASNVSQRIKNVLADLGEGVALNWRGRGLSELTTVAFMERLGAHPLSDRIVAKAGTAGSEAANALAPNSAPSNPEDAVLQDVAQKFEAYANEASVFFERRARTLSVAVAFVVAFALHVDAIKIFKTFMRDPALAEAVIARKDEFTKAFEARAAVEKRPAVAANAAELQSLQQAAKDAEQLKKDYAAMIAALKATEDQLSSLGVPIGWPKEGVRAIFPRYEQPVCEADSKRPYKVSADQQCQAGERRRVRVSYGLVWSVLLGLLLGGLLVGLGGPFWYDIIKSLTSIRNIAQGKDASAPLAVGAAPAAAGAAAPTPQPRTPVEAFKAARAAWIASGRPMRQAAVRPVLARSVP